MFCSLSISEISKMDALWVKNTEVTKWNGIFLNQLSDVIVIFSFFDRETGCACKVKWNDMKHASGM